MSRATALAEHINRISKEIFDKNPNPDVLELIVKLLEHSQDVMTLEAQDALRLVNQQLRKERGV